MNDNGKIKNAAAVALGRLGRGIPKRITPTERHLRQQRAAYARAVKAQKTLKTYH